MYYSVALAADDIGGSNRYANYILTSLVDFPAVLIGIYACRRYSFVWYFHQNSRAYIDGYRYSYFFH